MVAHRELEGLEKQTVFWSPFGSIIINQGPAGQYPNQGIYRELKQHTDTSMRFWAGAADRGFNALKAGGTVGIALATRLLSSKEDGKGKEGKSGDSESNSNEKKKTTLENNRTKGKEAETTVTKELEDEFPDDEVLTQVTGKFKDGKTTVFDNVIVDGKTGKAKETNETKSGGAKLTKPQARYRNGETVELKGEKAGKAAGQKINVNEVPDRVTRR